MQTWQQLSNSWGLAKHWERANEVQIDALRKLKAHLELKLQGKHVAAGFWNVFDDTSKLSVSDEKGLEEVAAMLNHYASELLKLQKEPLAAVDKATLDLIPKFI